MVIFIHRWEKWALQQQNDLYKWPSGRDENEMQVCVTPELYQGSPWELDCRSLATKLKVVTQKQMEVAHWDCSDAWNRPSGPSFDDTFMMTFSNISLFFFKVGDEWMNESLLGRIRLCLLSAHGRYGIHGRYGPIRTPPPHHHHQRKPTVGSMVD